MAEYSTISTNKQVYIKLTTANWDIYKFQSQNYFYEVDGEDIINEKEKMPSELNLETHSSMSLSSSSSSSSSVLSKKTGSAEEVEDYNKEMKLYLAKTKKMYLYIVNTQSEETVGLIRHVESEDPLHCQHAIRRNLYDHFESKTLASIKQLMSQLIRCKYDSPQFGPGLTLKFAGELREFPTC